MGRTSLEISKMPERNTTRVSRKNNTFDVPLVIFRIKRDKMRTISVITAHISKVMIRGIFHIYKNSIPAPKNNKFRNATLYLYIIILIK